jgi:signal transduction histidine kinase
VPRPKTPRALVGALGLLKKDWQAGFRDLAHLLEHGGGALDRRFLAQLRQRGCDAKQRKALAAVTGGAAVQILAQGRPVSWFLEQVDYNGRRLAKLNLPPSAVLEFVASYDQMLEKELGRRAPQPAAAFHPIRQQLKACIAITLNNAFYQVREAETRVFYELGRAELEAKHQAQLLARSETVLRRFCQAQAARILIRGGQDALPRELSRPRYLDLGRGGSAKLLLAPHWTGLYRSAWSIPLPSPGRLAGVMQFGFSKPYQWLPRELQLLEAAGERCRLAAEKMRLLEELAASEEQVRKLAGHMLQVEEAERRRISRELHDETGQLLLYLRLQLEMLENRATEAAPELKAGLAGARQLIEQTIVEIRRLLADLSPAVLEQLGLPAALRQLVSRFRRLHSFALELNLARLGRLAPKIETVVYRLVQECLNNIARHSSARTVMVSLERVDRALRLQVSDDGIGFDVEAALAKKGSFGLAGMQERVALLGGLCELESRPGQGTRVAVWLPLPRPDAAEARSLRQGAPVAGRPASPLFQRG